MYVSFPWLTDHRHNLRDLGVLRQIEDGSAGSMNTALPLDSLIRHMLAMYYENDSATEFQRNFSQ